jgi:hypothetical protein
VVIRRVVRKHGVDQLGSLSSWMRSPDGQFQWTARNAAQLCEDPDPTLRPQLQTGQPALDRQLSLQTLASAWTEVSTPAFVAPPAVCEAAGRTFVYATVPTASSEASTRQPPPPQYDPQTLAASLPTLLRQGAHAAPAPGLAVDYQFMSDDYARANAPANFLTFSLTLRMLYTVFGAFEATPQAASLIATLNKHAVQVGGGAVPMGAFYQQAAGALIDHVPGSSGRPTPWVTMPQAWDSFSGTDEAEILGRLAVLLQLRSLQVLAPTGRFQDASRLYRLAVFLRVRSEMPGCCPCLVWSPPSDPFRIAAWHESAGRTQAPVPLPDPFDPNFRKSAKPNCFFAVPPKLMNAMQGTTLSGLTSGAAGSSGGVGLAWICGFSIPLITICAFFVLNIFLTLLNLVFFWLPFIKICIPFPVPKSASSGDGGDS